MLNCLGQHLGEGFCVSTKSLYLSTNIFPGWDAQQGSFVLVSERAGSHSEKALEASKHSGKNRGWMEKEATIREDTGAEIDGRGEQSGLEGLGR